MGLSRCLLRRVFSKRSSSEIHESHERNWGAEKNRWNSVRFFHQKRNSIRFFGLCGDQELNIVVGEEDLASASVRSSGATIAAESDLVAEANAVDEARVVNETQEQEEISNIENSLVEPSSLQRDDAAILIQAAFRGFLVRQQCRLIISSDEVQYAKENVDDTSGMLEVVSTEAQQGDNSSIHTCYCIDEESVMVQQHVSRKSRNHQSFRPKEGWDDSTVSSTISRMRIQNKLEASTRRERALAYAFSQQLRSCTISKKKSVPSDSSLTSNMGWSWLERWMAARQPEINKNFDQISVDQKPMAIKKRIDFEEKESCGSNDVSVNFDASSALSQTPRNGLRPAARNRLKAVKKVPRREKLSSYHRSARSRKVAKRVSERESEKEQQRFKQEQPKTIDEIKERDASEAPSDY